MKRILFISIVLAGFFSFSFIFETLQLLIPGVGIENYVTINATTLNEIKVKYGTGYKEVKHYSAIDDGSAKVLYSTEWQYAKQGVSFYFRPDRDTVFAIHVRTPFKGKTTKGIIIGTSTMQDAQDAYGKVEWSYTDTQMFLEYPGISFYVPFNGKFPVPKTVEENALKKKIDMIGITAIEE